MATVFEKDVERLKSACGIDVGASLAKIVTMTSNGELRYQVFRALDLDLVCRRAQQARCQVLGATGGGALRLQELLGTDITIVNEHLAWGVGASQMETDAGESETAQHPYVLVSVGTGTSVLVVDGHEVKRVGGSALGGGTIMGLGRALLGPCGFADICELAARGEAARYNLLVGDIYSEVGGAGPTNSATPSPDAASTEQVNVPSGWTASNFGRLSWDPKKSGRREDLAAALMSLVGENLALIVCALADLADINRVVVAGSALRDNPSLRQVLSSACEEVGGKSVHFLPKGEFSGAYGAMLLALAGTENMLTHASPRNAATVGTLG